MHSKSDNIEIMINDEADEVIKELFKSLKKKYENNLQLMKGSEFLLDYVHLLYYKCHKIHLDRGGPYIVSLYWIKNEKAPINIINKRDNIHQEIFKNLQKITKIEPFLNKYF